MDTHDTVLLETTLILWYL